MKRQSLNSSSPAISKVWSSFYKHLKLPDIHINVKLPDIHINVKLPDIHINVKSPDKLSIYFDCMCCQGVHVWRGPGQGGRKRGRGK